MSLGQDEQFFRLKASVGQIGCMIFEEHRSERRTWQQTNRVVQTAQQR